MKLTILRAACLCAASMISHSTFAQSENWRDNSWTFSAYFENDLFGDTDQNYTNGVKLTWNSPDLTHYRDDPNLPRWILPVVDRLPFINESGLQRNITFSIGQKIFTPEDIASEDLVENGRPYAGWLFAGLGFHNKNPSQLDSIELQIGVVGPAALGEQVQNEVHRLRNLDLARGWDNQLKNELGIAAVYERKWRVFEHGVGEGLGYDVITHAGASLGNVFTYANAGFEIRAGWNIPADFGTSLIRPGGDTNAPVKANDPRFNSQGGFGLHLFVLADGRAVARDIFLDGNTFLDSHSVDKEYFVLDAAAGISLVRNRFKLSYAQVFRSREFKSQKENHRFGSMSVSYSY